VPQIVRLSPFLRSSCSVGCPLPRCFRCLGSGALAEHTRRTLDSAVGGPSFGCCAKITRDLSPLRLFSLVSSEGYSGLFFGVFFVFIFSACSYGASRLIVVTLFVFSL
jgi:hypothetical protein